MASKEEQAKLNKLMKAGWSWHGCSAGGGGDLAKQIVERTITEINNDTVESVGEYAFYGCQALTSVNLPNAENVQANAFANDAGLVSIAVPKVKTIGDYAFQVCKALKMVDLPSATSIGKSAFAYCGALYTLILRNTEQVCTAGSSVFMGAGLATKGYIYVPAALIDSYKTATNWSTYASQFRALEDYTVDGTTTGALDETKL